MMSFNLRLGLLLGAASLLVFGVSYYADLKQKLFNLQTIRQEKAILKRDELATENNGLASFPVRQQKNKMQKILSAEQFAVKTQQFLKVSQFILHAATFNQLKVSVLELRALQTIDGWVMLPVHVVVSGSLFQYQQFITRLLQYDFLTTLSTYEMSLNSVNQLKVSAVFSVWGIVEQAHKQKTADDLDSITQMKQVGYLVEKQIIKGLVMLSNGQTRLVELNDLLGKEQAKVIAITEDHIVVRMGREQKILRKDYGHF